MEQVSIEEFAKVQLCIGKIVSAEDHPNADKLYVLKVDIGGETKQLVAGIRNYYTIEQLVGKIVVVVKNLQPAVIRGVESEGMVLAAQDIKTNDIVLLTAEKDVSLGSKIR